MLLERNGGSMFNFLNGPYKYIAIAAIVAIDLLLIFWGASILYRGLDGDRITLNRRIKGRWTNSINFVLIFSGLFVMLVGAGLGWGLVVGATDDGSATNVLRSLVSVLVLTAAIVMVSWAWAGRRAAGKPRCPQCFYDVSATPGMICPECGYEAETTGHWYKPKKRKRWIIAGSFLGLIAVGMIIIPSTIGYAWRRLIPTQVLVAGMGTLPDSIIGLTQEQWGQGKSGSLLSRLSNAELSASQIDTLVEKAETGIVESRDAQELLRWVTFAQYLPEPIQPQFTQQSASRMVDQILLSEPDGADGTWQFYQNTVDWTGINVFDEDTAASLAASLLAFNPTSLSTALISTRFNIALALDPDTDFLKESIEQILTVPQGLESQYYEIQSLLSTSNENKKRIVASLLWKNWLESKDRIRQIYIIRLFRRTLGNDLYVPDELRDRIVAKLAETVAQDIPEKDQAEMMLYPYWMSTTPVKMLQQLLHDEEIQSIVLAAQQNRLTKPHIAIIATYLRPGPNPPFPIPMLIDLAGHEDPLVRAAAGLAIEQAIIDQREAVRPYDDQLLKLDPSPFNEDFRQSLRLRLLREQRTPPD
jgi:hypothetical protein